VFLLIKIINIKIIKIAMESEINQKNQASKSKDIIGSYLSLITKAESRYEGTLFEVDRQNKTMSLKNVKNFGTEGRRNGENELTKSDSIIG
jgi:protein LSM14